MCTSHTQVHSYRGAFLHALQFDCLAESPPSLRPGGSEQALSEISHTLMIEKMTEYL